MPNLKNPMAPQELLVAGAALKMGIFDALRDKATSLEELASNLSMDHRALWTVMEALISLGYVNRNGETLKVTMEANDLFFNEDSENYLGNSLIHTFNVIKAWTHLPEILKSGQPYKYERDQQDIKGFMSAMKKTAKEIAQQLVTISLDGLPEKARVLDLGGGPLNYARPFAAAGAEVTVQDIPEVCAIMEPTLLPEENIKFVPGDFTEEVFSGQFNLIFLGNICHIYGEEENLLLFKRVHDSLQEGGRITILDFVRGVSPRAELFGVNMLANTKTGGTWTLDQYTDWLKAAGFSQVKMHDIDGRQILTATRGA
ncbi:methyltransferase [Pelosinus sp. IPA-1]|uniref:methyltransferase n=1 Tax=Pelosinus sp. IPA-1 TaxID=3029569 RepID=UPI0024361D82|nr:methyltransferase [Pelosinus sp. IPA-1]GMA97943.1 SAM-dependent methyltransferase [Pelosinus sp. IPA-1]